MPGTVVIGVGGGGRGAVNWVKYFLEKEYGSCRNAGVSILVIDGPENDQYILPGEFQIDTSKNSPEYYPLTLNPSDAIGNIARGEKFECIDEWLTQEDAGRLPIEQIRPQDGYGGMRANSFAGLFLESANLEERIRKLLHQNAGFNTRETMDIFVMGSLAGGTGSGMLLGISHLIKKLKGNNNLYGCILLPNGYDSVINDNAMIMARDAKSFAGLRELLRYQSASRDYPTRIAFARNTQVENSQLFDFIFLIDGDGEGNSLKGLFPVYGLCAKAAELVLTCVKDNSDIASNKINWITDLAQEPGSRRFSTFGVHSYYYPAADIIEDFALRVVRDVYHRMYTVPLENANDGKNLAENILQKTKFGNMMVNYSRNRRHHLEPPLPDRRDHEKEFTTLANHIRINDSGANYPFYPILELSEAVNNRKRFFVGLSNENVVEGCREETAYYLGREDEARDRTVWDWLRTQISLISSDYATEVCRVIWGLFYDPQTNEPLPLERKPFSIGVVKDMLESLKDYVRQYQALIDQYINNHLENNNIVNTQEQVVYSQAERLFELAKSNKNEQDQYIAEHQKLLQLKVWEISIRGCEQLVREFERVNDILWEEIGDNTKGWVDLLEKCNGYISRWSSELDNIRSQINHYSGKTFVPRYHGKEMMYQQKVTAERVVEGMLRNMSWGIVNALDDRITGLIEGTLTPADLQNLTVVLLKKFTMQEMDEDLSRQMVDNRRIKEFVPEGLIRLAKTRLKHLNNLTVWDALYYDSKGRPLDADDADPAARLLPQIEHYANRSIVKLFEKGGILLGLRVARAGNLEMNEFLLSSYLTAVNPPPDSMEYLSNCFYDEAKRRRHGGEVNSQHNFRNQITALVIANKIDIFNWAYYDRCRENYADFINSPEYYPIHLGFPEKKAGDLESRLYDYRYLDRNKLLDPELVKYFTRDFCLLAYALVAGLFGEQVATPEGPRYRLEVMVRQRPQTKEISTDLVELLKTYYARDNEPLRQAVGNKWREYLEANSGNIKNVLEGNLREFADAELRAPEDFPIAHFKLAVRAETMQFIDRF